MAAMTARAEPNDGDGKAISASNSFQHAISEYAASLVHGFRLSVRVNDAHVPPPYTAGQCLNVAWNPSSSAPQVHPEELVSAVKKNMGVIGRNEHVIHPRMLGRQGTWTCEDLAMEGVVPGTNLLLSFRPCGDSGAFLIMHEESTEGWVREDIPTAKERRVSSDGGDQYSDGDRFYIKIRNDVYFIKDPIRPYSIQIGGIRSLRPHANAGIIEGRMTVGELRQLPIHLYWLSLTLAEILTDPAALRYLFDHPNSQDWSPEESGNVRSAIARNPFAPDVIQREACQFCDANFKNQRRLYSRHGATIIANDFPFGPRCHYVAIVDDPVHSWEEIRYEHLLGVNKAAWEFLKKEVGQRHPAGIEYGFNSTVRHLVLGSKTRSSAGASIPHIHKQFWGMVPRTSNLADQLIEVSEAYSNLEIDYQGCYLAALRDAGYVIWEDDRVALFVPYGQCSMHELQVMVKESRGTYLDLVAEEVESFSKAEFIVFRLYRELGITSFNSLLLSKLFNDNRAPWFKVVQTFVTREVDMAVSELSMLFVVDQHPAESLELIKKAFTKLEHEVKNAVCEG